MTSQEIITEIRSLKSDLNDYADRMVHLRYDDLKAAFLQQMRMAVGEEGRRTFQNDALELKDSSSCPSKAGCMSKLEAAIEDAAAHFKQDDFAGAERILDDVEGLITGDCGPCQDGDCSQQAAETIRKVRAVLQVYEGLAGMFEADERLLPYAAGEDKAKPEEIELLLDPLANAWRIKVLSVLRSGDRSLTELGRALNLRTGHLQFHLRALIDAGYVSLDRRRHRYSISERGSTALACAEEMAAKIGPPPELTLIGSSKRKGGAPSNVI